MLGDPRLTERFLHLNFILTFCFMLPVRTQFITSCNTPIKAVVLFTSRRGR